MYEGEWRDDKMHGQGVRTWTDGERYEGEYRRHEMHGEGTYTYADGERYHGEFRNDKRHGQGMSTFPDGESYKGEFREDKRHGVGAGIFPDGQRYEGEYCEDMEHGQGMYVWVNGDKYEGACSAGDLEGHGTFASAAGWSYTGGFTSGRPTQGLLTEADGKRFEVTYGEDCVEVWKGPMPVTRKRLGSDCTGADSETDLGLECFFAFNEPLGGCIGRHRVLLLPKCSSEIDVSDDDPPCTLPHEHGQLEPAAAADAADKSGEVQQEGRDSGDLTSDQSTTIVKWLSGLLNPMTEPARTPPLKPADEEGPLIKPKVVEPASNSISPTPLLVLPSTLLGPADP